MSSFSSEEGIWKSTVDDTELLARRWLPAGEKGVKAVVIICHGYMEHSGRYEKLADVFCKKGWGVYAMDHRGHGKSEDVDGTRAFFWKFEHLVSDFSGFVGKVLGAHTHAEVQPLADVLAGASHETNSELQVPVFIMGHSMGGLCVSRFLLEHGKYKQLKGIVLSSPFFGPADHVNCVSKGMGKFTARILPKIGVAKIPDNSISRNMEECEKYNDDPLNTRASVTCNVAKEFFASHDFVHARFGEFKLPVLFLQGTADKLVSPAAAEDCYNLCASDDKFLSKYKDAGHELLNELPETSAAFIQEVTSWIEKRI